MYERADSVGFAYYVPDQSRLTDVLVGLGMAESAKQAKNLIREKGVRVNERVVEDCQFTLAGNRVSWEGLDGHAIQVGNGIGLGRLGRAKKYFVAENTQ